MTNLEKFNQKTMSSREIAELTNKEHKTVMRDIRNLIDNLNKNNGYTSVPVEEIQKDYHRGDRTQYKYLSEKTQDAVLNFCFGNKESEYIFSMSEYIDLKGEKRPQYELNKKAALLLASGYDIVLRAKIIDRWEELENTNNSPELQMAQGLIAAQKIIENKNQQIQILEGENEMLVEENKILAPKAEYTDNVLQSKSTYTSTQLAKELGLRSAEHLHKELKQKGVMFYQSGQWLLTSKYCGKGYTEPRTHRFLNHKTGIYETNTITVWSEKGRKFLHELLKIQIVA